MIRADVNLVRKQERSRATRRVTGACAALLLFGSSPGGAAPSAPKEHARIAADLESGRIAEAQEWCLEQPRRMYDLVARLPYGASRPPQAGIYADLFARCAVVSLRAGDPEEAAWRWAVAHVFEAGVAREAATTLGALADLPAARRAGDALPTLAVVEKRAWREVESWMLGAPDDVFRPSVTGRSRLSLRGGFQCTLAIEAILGPSGRLRDPAVVSRDRCVATQVAIILDALGRRPYPTAKSETGEPIAVAYLLTLAERVESNER